MNENLPNINFNNNFKKNKFKSIVLTKLKNLIFKINYFVKSCKSIDLRKKIISLYPNYTAIILLIISLSILFLIPESSEYNILSPLAKSLQNTTRTELTKTKNEVLGFAPYWTFTKLDNIDFNVLTTLAYFDIPIDYTGNLVKDGPGYSTFKSHKAKQLFSKAHDNGTNVILTVTQMDNATIRSFLDNPQAQSKAINQIKNEVKENDLDGVNVDIEYNGNPGADYRNKFTQFVGDLTYIMHKEISGSTVSVSVYASSIKDPKIYDIENLSKKSDQIFMMAYDFAVSGSENAMPTSPLYGYKDGTYWYDVSSAVDDFLKYMLAEKLVLGVPYYGYNYSVYTPQVKAQTMRYFWGSGVPKTYSDANNEIDNEFSLSEVITGWDDIGKVGWKAYFDWNTYYWRMIFLEDTRSLSIKYDFVKEKGLKGIGIWALGFDDGKTELWSLLKEKFGSKFAETNKEINNKNI